MTHIGIFSFQGDFEKHERMVLGLGAKATLMRSAAELAHVDGVIIPGGESTTIGKLMHAYGVLGPLRSKIDEGMPVFGTCAGLILLGPHVVEKNQFRLGALDIEVERNAYGRQVDSFEADITIDIFGAPSIRGVFIRAPIVRSVSNGIRVLASHEQHPVLLRKENILASSFHPELTDDPRVHEYFLSFIN
ncbi:MAG: pyridoxal 5'-phosphate synthase glutaminase subunit PdxT [Spirochaetales bacterium]|nr:pyridoxal 5'-phosphate synthase glutaminase subunit PdxT [Spirochaetales bacterium]